MAADEVLKLPDRIYSQYRDKPKTVEWLDITRKIGHQLVKAADDVRDSLDLDKATGESLKIISRILVIDTVYRDQLNGAAIFAKPDGTQFNTDDPMFAEWSSRTKGELNDEILRILCKAKIEKNNLEPTAESLLAAFQRLFPTANMFRVINHHDMSFSAEYAGRFTPVESYLLSVTDFIPSPQGVRFRGFLFKYLAIEFLADDDWIFGDEDLEFQEVTI
jgi:hypothetical protein|nr:MAG TPA: Protein of unknown function (DUF2612) [Caudoviricetes sp.]